MPRKPSIPDLRKLSADELSKLQTSITSELSRRPKEKPIGWCIEVVNNDSRDNDALVKRFVRIVSEGDTDEETYGTFVHNRKRWEVVLDETPTIFTDLDVVRKVMDAIDKWKGEGEDNDEDRNYTVTDIPLYAFPPKAN